MADLDQVKLIDFLEEVSTGAIVIPDFQRDFVWKIKQIEELLNSIINNYFIGSILLLESSTDDLRFAPRFIRGVDRDSKNLSRLASIKYILDGQQRVTSLFYAFFEPEVPLSSDTAFICKFYLKPDNTDIFGLEDPEDITRKLRLGADVKKKLYEIYTGIYGIDIHNLPTMAVFKSKTNLDEYFSANPGLTPVFKGKMTDLFDKVQTCTIPLITLPTDTSDDDIVNVFERINRTGTRLGIFELAVAKYYPIGIKLNELKGKIQGDAFLEVVDEESILKVMALMLDLEPKPQNLVKLTDPQRTNPENLAEFHTNWHTAVEYLTEALTRIRYVYGGRKIRVGKRTLDLVPYTSLLIPLADLMLKVENAGKSKALFDKVDYWYWTSVFTQKYSHATDSKSFSDVRSLKEWFENDAAKPDWVFNAEHIRGEMLKASRTSALGKGFYNMLVLNSGRDLLTGQNIELTECNIDHLFPSSKFKATADCVFNLTIVDKRTNQKKKDKLPSEFVKDCLASHGNNEKALLRTLESHFISEKGLVAMQADNIDSFIRERAETFFKVLTSKMMGY